MKFLSNATYNFLRDCEEGNLNAVQEFVASKSKKKVVSKLITRIFVPKLLTIKINLCKYKYLSNGYSPLHLAILSGNVKLIEYLIEIDKKLIYQKDDKGRSPFHLISLSKNSDIWREIIKKRELNIFIENIYN